MLFRSIDANRAESLAQEFSEYVSKYNIAGDSTAPRSPAVYNFLPFARLLVEKIPQVSDILGESVLPTYTYARTYAHGERLFRHRDREACEISLTLNLKKDTNWPIGMQKPNGEDVYMELNPGDAILYLACQTDHWRDTYGGYGHTQVFLHYVKSFGSKAWAVFDKESEPNPTQPNEDIPDIPVTRL